MHYCFFFPPELTQPYIPFRLSSAVSLNPFKPELNPSMQRCLTRFLLGIFLLELCISLIQGDSEGICNTLGNDSICDSKQKCSYEHGSDFERLPKLW
jgi:hypothetical protein